MNLDPNSLAGTPILAGLVTDAAIRRAGALELLDDNYKPPQPWTFHITSEDVLDEGADDEGGEPEKESPVEVGTQTDEVDADGYPAVVEVPRVAPPTPPRGVRLIRPRSLSDMQAS